MYSLDRRPIGPIAPLLLSLFSVACSSSPNAVDSGIAADLSVGSRDDGATALDLGPDPRDLAVSGADLAQPIDMAGSSVDLAGADLTPAADLSSVDLASNGPHELLSIDVTPKDKVTWKNRTIQYTATARYTGGREEVLTTAVWSVDRPAFADIDANGQLHTLMTDDLNPIIVTAALGGTKGTAKVYITTLPPPPD